MRKAKRPHNVMLRLDADHFEKLNAWSAAKGLPLAVGARALIGKSLGGKAIQPRRNIVDLDVSRLIMELRGIGHSLHQVLHLMQEGNGPDLAEQIEVALDELAGLKSEILDALCITRDP